jgi:hypothetical protein
MFNLEQSIAEWRRKMLAAGIEAPAPLDELELHLREDIEVRVKSGWDERQAFEMAAEQIGRAGLLQKEFMNAGIPVHERLKHFVSVLAGIPNHQLATNMNTNLNLEPRWATYAKAGTFLFPAVFLWLLTAVFVLPKANEICQRAGTTVYNFDHAPAVFQALAVIGQAMIFLTYHGFLTAGAIVLAFVLLERYFNRWPHYRRAAIGAGVFLFNAVVLISLSLMIISILIAAPALAQHL